ncbi:MAG TPA: sugar transferase [Gaiellaceae bacterium]|nr:sugar transferase [Gaiellaceae bacterium]
MRLDSTVTLTRSQTTATRTRGWLRRAIDVGLAAALILLFTPLLVLIAVTIKIDSRGPVFFRCRRAGYRGREFEMLKFRKMYDSAGGSPLTSVDDARFTRVGSLLARTKLDEIPQLFNVLRGEMSLVGPRPEDPSFVAPRRSEFDVILSVRPGITGLSQLAFARETQILAAEDREGDYERRILPQKLQLDRLYADRATLRTDFGILVWTIMAVVFSRSVAVHRADGRLTLRRRPRPMEAPATAPAAQEVGSHAA